MTQTQNGGRIVELGSERSAWLQGSAIELQPSRCHYRSRIILLHHGSMAMRGVGFIVLKVLYANGLLKRSISSVTVSLHCSLNCVKIRLQSESKSDFRASRAEVIHVRLPHQLASKYGRGDGIICAELWVCDAQVVTN